MKSLKRLVLDNFTHSDFMGMEFVKNRMQKIEERKFDGIIMLTNEDYEIFNDLKYSLTKITSILKMYYNE